MFQRNGVHTEAKACWGWAILEHMAKVRITTSAKDLSSNHKMTPIPLSCHRFWMDWSSKTRPSRARIKLIVCIKQ